MNILYVTSEAAPFAASGGLGDVMGALPQAVKSASPDDSVSVIMPYYKKKVPERLSADFRLVSEFRFRYVWRDAYAGIYATEYGGVTYYLIDNEQYFLRPDLYGQFDDGERFAFFSMAVVEFMLKMERLPDVLHANDWQSALTLVYLRTKYAQIEALRAVRTVYTIHNIEYQGKYDLSILGDIFGLEDRFRPVVEYDGCINLMKGAIVVADRVTTVSPNYACELRQAYFAFGLQHVINANGHKLSGIINGIDTAYFSPDRGGDVAFPYSLADVWEGKAKNKTALQRELGLPIRRDVPLVVMITRLARQKGVDLLTCILDELLGSDMQFVILGTGDADYEATLREIAERHPDKMRALIKFDRALSKRLYASADIFLMPSRSEPCGLAQMIACSYGTIPVVRAVGGLYDTIMPYGQEGANGFVFGNYNAHELLFRVKDALSLYRNSDEWGKLIAGAMNTDFTWDRSAKKYLSLYRGL